MSTTQTNRTEPATVGTTITLGNRTWRVTEVKSDEELPSLRAHLLDAGLDGYTYVAERVLTSKRQRPAITYLIRAADGHMAPSRTSRWQYAF